MKGIHRRTCDKIPHKHGRGQSSYWMHDPTVVFHDLRLKAGDFFLDLGCGPGDYAIEASGIVGSFGKVYALDNCRDAIQSLIEKADSQGIENIKAMVCDITGPLPIEDGCVDVCLLSTVLHIFNLRKVEEGLFKKIRRVLKPEGRIAIIECKKEEQPFGPPIHMRLSSNDVEK